MNDNVKTAQQLDEHTYALRGSGSQSMSVKELVEYLKEYACKLSEAFHNFDVSAKIASNAALVLGDAFRQSNNVKKY